MLHTAVTHSRSTDPRHVTTTADCLLCVEFPAPPPSSTRNVGQRQGRQLVEGNWALITMMKVWVYTTRTIWLVHMLSTYNRDGKT